MPFFRNPFLRVWLLMLSILLWIFASWYFQIGLSVGDNFRSEPADLSAFFTSDERVQDIKPSIEKSDGLVSTIDSSVHLDSNISVSRDSLPNAVILPADSAYPHLAMDRAVDTSTQRILLAGDSMAENLYFSFYTICKWSNYRFQVLALRGSSSPTWAGSDTLKRTIARYKPTLVLFTLGANEIMIPKLSLRKRYYQKIISQLDSTHYVWIGSPVWTADTNYRIMIRGLVPANQFFDSQGIVLERQADGAHPTIPASKVWADSIARWLVYRSRYPVYFQLRKPANYKQRVYNPTPVFGNKGKKNISLSSPKKKQTAKVKDLVTDSNASSSPVTPIQP
jgi:hypothetical protein